MNPFGNVVIGIAVDHVGPHELVLAMPAVAVVVHVLLLLSPAIRARPTDTPLDVAPVR